MAHHNPLWSLVLIALLLQLGAVCAAAPSWVLVQPSGQVNEQCLVDLGVDYRGRFDFFSLVVADEANTRRAGVECCPGCRLQTLPRLRLDDALWVVEATTEVANRAAALLGPTVTSFRSPSGGSVSFVLTADEIQYISDKATLIPVPTQAVTLPNLEYNPIRVKFASGESLSADPVIERIVAAVDPGLVEKTDVHLSSYFSRLAIGTGAVEAQQWITNYYQSLPGLKVNTQFFRAGYSENVIAELEGAEDPSQVVLIGAHYDSRATSITNPDQRAPGADDNGSGTAAILELARVFATGSVKFKYTIRFCSWSGEEQGLLGSREYAKLAKQDGEDIIAVLNADMIGYRRANTPVGIAFVTRYTTEWLTDAAEEATRLYVPELDVGYTTGCCSDQQSFVEQGYPAMGFFETPGAAVIYPHYHQSTDLPQYMDFKQVGLITKAAAASLAAFAEPLH